MTTLAPIKYVFLDVVDFTMNRSVEAQADVVEALNSIVRAAVVSVGVPAESVLYIPTGDGMCIAIIAVDHPYDIHILLATAIVAGVTEYNQTQASDSRRFSVRLGVNANIDNLIRDINGNSNVAGAGINMAARIMGLADGNQILISSAAYDVLRYREAYEKAFRPFAGSVKHDLPIEVYQLVAPSPGLITTVPRAFQPRIRVLPPLSGAVAHYFALSHKFRDFLMHHNEQFAQRAGVVWLWYRASDAATVESSKQFERPTLQTHGAGHLSDEQQLEYYEASNFNLIWDFAECIIREYLAVYGRYFEVGADGVDYRFINAEGVTRVTSEAPGALLAAGAGGA